MSIVVTERSRRLLRFGRAKFLFLVLVVCLSLLAYLAVPASHASIAVTASSNSQIPFDGLNLAYYSETTPVFQAYTGVSATGWGTFNFRNVTTTSSIMEIDVNGTASVKGQQTPVNLTLTVSFPTDRDTLLYLRNGGQQELTIYAGPVDESFQIIPDYTFNLTRTWSLLGQWPVTTPLGSFTTYRYHTSQTLGDTVLDFYAYYEVTSQVLVYGEVFANRGVFNAQMEKISLREQNFQLATANQSPKCIIATAAYGSELAPPVQFLRTFRDQQVQGTYVGSRFISVFNAWYYSWAPGIAELESQSSYLRAVIRVLITPLLGALFVSATMFSSLSPLNPEVAMLISGVFVSALIGLTYLTPLAFITKRVTKRKLTAKSLVYFIILGLVLTLIGTLAHGTLGVVENLTALVVIETILVTPILTVRVLTSRSQ